MDARTLLILIVVVFSAAAAPAAAGTGACDRTAQAVTDSCTAEAQKDYSIGVGNCLNRSHTDADMLSCQKHATAEQKESLDDCATLHDAYLKACSLLGQEPYDPVIDPA